MEWKGLITEIAYMGNIGFHEMCQFYKVATPEEEAEMEEIIEAEDWVRFKKLISLVVGTELK